MTQPRYRFADLTLDNGQRCVTRDGRPIELPKLTYALLAALVEAAPDVLTHDELVRRVWGGRLTSPETVTQRVKLLRDALGDEAERPRYVGLVRGQGYRLLPPVRRLADEPATARTPAVSSTAVTSLDVRKATPHPRGLAGAAALVAVLVVGFVGFVMLRDAGSGATNAAPPAGAPPSRTDVQAESRPVAVLPFVNDSRDPEQEAFADGLSATLIDALGRIPGVVMAGRASSFHFKGRNEPLDAVARALNVEHVLTGSVRRSGDRLRISAELVDARTGFRLWGDTYERPLEDIFSVQDEITEHVAAALQITLGVGRLASVPGAVRNVEAYVELVQGDGWLREARPDTIRLAIDHFLRATQLDASSSVAWISLASAYAAGSGLVPERALEWRRNAAEAADKARALTPHGMHVLLWDAQRSIDRGDWIAAAAFFERLDEEPFPLLVRESGPEAAARFLKGAFLLEVGRAADAVAQFEKVRATEPALPLVARLLGDAYAATGDAGAALAEIDRGIQLGWDLPALQGYAVAAALASRDRGEILRRVEALWPSPATDAHRRMAALLDDPAGAVAELRGFVAAPAATPDDFLTPLVLAHWAGYYGDAPTALALLRRIPRELFTADVAVALWRPVFAEARTLPEFAALVHERGFVDYWRAFGWPDFCAPDGDSIACR